MVAGTPIMASFLLASLSVLFDFSSFRCIPFTFNILSFYLFDEMVTQTVRMVML